MPGRARSIHLTFCLALMLPSAGTLIAQTKAKAQNVPEIPYETVPNFIKLPPGLYLGEAMGVATNSKLLPGPCWGVSNGLARRFKGHYFDHTRSAIPLRSELHQNRSDGR